MSEQNISPVFSSAAPVTALFGPPIWLVAGVLTSLTGFPLSNLTTAVVADVNLSLAVIHVTDVPAPPAVVADLCVPPDMVAHVPAPPCPTLPHLVADVSVSSAVVTDVSVPPAVVADVHVPPAAVADVTAALGVTLNSTVSTISIVFTPISLTRPIQSICRARNSHKLGILTSSPCTASLAEKVEKMNKTKQPKIKFVQEATPDIYVVTTSSIASNRTAPTPTPTL